MYRLHLGDCLEILPTLESGSIDLIATDIPYGTTACAWDTIIPFAPMWEQVKRVLKPCGVFLTTASQPFTSALVMSNPKWFRHEWIWDKGVTGSFANAKHSPLKTHENILVFGKDATTYNPQMMRRDKSVRIGGIGKSVQGGRKIKHNALLLSSKKEYTHAFPKSVIYESPRRDKKRGLHPTQKPVALYEYLIRTYSNPGETVLDFCFGSCTTGVAALRTQRDFIGIERDAEYFALGQKRMAETALQPPLFVDPPPPASPPQQARLDGMG